MSTDVERVMTQCSQELFTGLLHVRTPQGRAEVRFLSGIQDDIRFDALQGDAALQRLLASTEAEFEAVSALPPIDLGSPEPLPLEGRLDHFHAARLMRFCENNSLTCELEIEAQDTERRTLTARYRLGELLSIEPDSEHAARLAEAKQGVYRFRLPGLALPSDLTGRAAPGLPFQNVSAPRVLLPRPPRPSASSVSSLVEPSSAPRPPPSPATTAAIVAAPLPAKAERALPESIQEVVAAQGPITLKSKVAEQPPRSELTRDTEESSADRERTLDHRPQVALERRSSVAPSHYWLASLALLAASAGIGWFLFGH